MRTLIFLFTALSLSSCISSKRVDQFVDEYYADRPIKPRNYGGDWYISSSEQETNGPYSLSLRKKAQFIPALVYFQWNTQVETELRIHRMEQQLDYYMDLKSEEMELPALLGNNRLQLQLSEVPGGFTYSHRGYFLFLLVGYVLADQILIIPEVGKYQLKYQVLNPEGKTLQEGVVETPRTDEPVPMGMKSRRKLVWSFLTAYHQDQDRAFGRLMDAIAADLKRQ